MSRTTKWRVAKAEDYFTYSNLSQFISRARCLTAVATKRANNFTRLNLARTSHHITHESAWTNVLATYQWPLPNDRSDSKLLSTAAVWQ